MVYVLDMNGNPLMPTSRHRWVRKSLKVGKAIVVRLDPFTIRLTYDAGCGKQVVTLGVRIGSKTIGLSATTWTKELFHGSARIRDDIKNLLQDRRTMRRHRRIRNGRYREVRNLNRKNRIGCLTITNENIVGSHIRILRMVMSILPIKKIVVQSFLFDLSKKYAYKKGMFDWKSIVNYKVNEAVSSFFGTLVNVEHFKSNSIIGEYELTGNTLSKRVDENHFARFVRRHNRQIHKARYSRGGIRKANQAAKYVAGIRLFDEVQWNGKRLFVSRRDTIARRFTLRDANWKMAILNAPMKAIKRKYNPGTILVERRTLKENTK